jgi:gluconate kinase
MKVLVLSGSMGAGKTTVMAEASKQLKAHGVLHGAADLDHFANGHYAPTEPDELMLRNLASVWANYAAVGADHLLISKPFDTMAKRDQLRSALPAAEIVICRLRAQLDTMKRRVEIRERGTSDRDEMVAHVAELERYLDAGQVEDFSVDNDNRLVADVACEVLMRAGWLSPDSVATARLAPSAHRNQRP